MIKDDLGSGFLGVLTFPETNIHPGRLTWNLKITYLKRKIIFQTSIIMFHVNLQGCSFSNIDGCKITFLLGCHLFRCELLVSGRVTTWWLEKKNSSSNIGEHLPCSRGDK